MQDQKTEQRRADHSNHARPSSLRTMFVLGVALAMMTTITITAHAAPAAASGQCEVRGTPVDSGLPAHECEALLALYHSTNGRNWRTPSWGAPWATLVDPCTWAGVSCTGTPAHKHRNVAQLLLSGYGLSGQLPAEIGDLGELWELNLEYNSIGGHLPPELGQLSTLSLAWLAHNRFTGEIPPELAQLSELWTLNLDYNNLEGELPKELGSMSDLAFLMARGNRLEGELPAEIGGMTNLRGLYLSHNNLGGLIPPEIARLTMTTQVFLHNPSNCFKADKATRLFIEPKLGNWQIPLVFC